MVGVAHQAVPQRVLRRPQTYAHMRTRRQLVVLSPGRIQVLLLFAGQVTCELVRLSPHHVLPRDEEDRAPETAKKSQANNPQRPRECASPCYYRKRPTRTRRYRKRRHRPKASVLGRSIRRRGADVLRVASGSGVIGERGPGPPPLCVFAVASCSWNTLRVASASTSGWARHVASSTIRLHCGSVPAPAQIPRGRKAHPWIRA